MGVIFGLIIGFVVGLAVMAYSPEFAARIEAMLTGIAGQIEAIDPPPGAPAEPPASAEDAGDAEADRATTQ